jgi:5-hydroxyisourate hydrolase
MKRISTHILDTAQGKPAAGIAISLFQGDEKIGSGVTDVDGRCQNLLLESEPRGAGNYRLVFQVAAHFPDGFYPEVTISFKVSADASHYHIPLLISPFGYTTYRGS